MSTRNFGLPFAIAFFVAGGTMAYISGLLADWAGWGEQVKGIALPEPALDAEAIADLSLVLEDSFVAKVKRAWRYAVDFFKRLAVYVVVGSAFAALIYGFLPEDLVVAAVSRAGVLAIPIAALIGTPLYLSTAAYVFSLI